MELAWESADQGDEQYLTVCKHNTNVSPGRPFQLSHSATTFHKLTLRAGADASDAWVISPASASQSVSQYLETTFGIERSRSRPPTILDLSKIPFEVYVHKQSPGDLLVVPPLWYVSPCWFDVVRF